MSCSTTTSICIVSFSTPVTLNRRRTMLSVPTCQSSSLQLQTTKIPVFLRLSQMESCCFTPWSGLKYMGLSISPKSVKIGRQAKCRGKGVYASLFGVGAPEALVIGVVALLVFGPKGLAEVARNLGKTLRAFQPTISELQDVSKEFKNTLEREIGLDDDPRSTRNPYDSNTAKSTTNPSVVEDFESVPVADPNGSPSSKAYTSEEYLKITEEQLKAAAEAQQGVSPSLQESQTEPPVASSPPQCPSETESPPQDSDSIPSSSESKIKSTSDAEATIESLEKSESGKPDF